MTLFYARLISTIALVCLLLAIAPLTVQAFVRPTTYLTEAGDTLASISKKFYGVDYLWGNITASNPRVFTYRNSYLLQPIGRGNSITIPTPALKWSRFYITNGGANYYNYYDWQYGYDQFIVITPAYMYGLMVGGWQYPEYVPLAHLEPLDQQRLQTWYKKYPPDQAYSSFYTVDQTNTHYALRIDTPQGVVIVRDGLIATTKPAVGIPMFSPDGRHLTYSAGDRPGKMAVIIDGVAYGSWQYVTAAFYTATGDHYAIVGRGERQPYQECFLRNGVLKECWDSIDQVLYTTGARDIAYRVRRTLPNGTVQWAAVVNGAPHAWWPSVTDLEVDFEKNTFSYHAATQPNTEVTFTVALPSLPKS